MDDIKTTHEHQSVPLSNNKHQDSNTTISDQNSHHKSESNAMPCDDPDADLIKYFTRNRPNYPTQNNPYENIDYPMSRLTMHDQRSANRSRPAHFRPYHHTVRPSMYYPSRSVNQPEAQAQLVAFTPPLMSVHVSHPDYQKYEQSYHTPRHYVQNYPYEQSSLSMNNKPETATPQPEYYVDSFASNFSDKPSSNSTNKSKTKHVTFQEPEETNETLSTPTNNNPYLTSSMPGCPPPPHHSSDQYYDTYDYHPMYNQYQGQYPNAMINPEMMTQPRGMNMMPMPPMWTAQPYYYNPRMSNFQHRFQTRHLYDPNKPKTPKTSVPHSNTPKVIRPIETNQKKKTKPINNTDTSNTPKSDPIPHQITILRKPSVETENIRASMMQSPAVLENPPVSVSSEPKTQMCSPDAASDVQKSVTSEPTCDNQQSLSSSSSIENPSEVPPPAENDKPASSESVSNTTLSFPSHDLLSILQSANCISAFNEYAQLKKFTINYDFSSVLSSFTCTVSINGRLFPTSAQCSSKNEAQKLACDQTLHILYDESCDIEHSPLEFSDKHDYIAHRSITGFQKLNVNESLHGRKTLACMLMITDGQYEKARVISIATGNSCLDETNLQYADDGTALHDCHAEILARRGLIRFLFEEIKQSKDSKTSIFQYNSTNNKFELNKNISFHMYISSLPCGNACFNTSSSSIRYKQGQTEGTIPASTNSDKYAIKSCSDKIYRWNILGIQGGLLINLLMRPIYLETITLASETAFDRNHLVYSLCERLNEHLNSLPSPFNCNSPDIDHPKTKSFQQERQVAKLQTSAFVWNITSHTRMELLEPMTGRLKNDRSMSLLSKRNLFEDFTKFIQTNFPDDNSLSYKTYQQAKQLNKTYVKVKDLISTAFGTGSNDTNISWISKSDKLEQFSME